MHFFSCFRYDILQEKFWSLKWKERNMKIAFLDVKKKDFKSSLIIRKHQRILETIERWDKTVNKIKCLELKSWLGKCYLVLPVWSKLSKTKEVQIVHRLFLVNCYLLHVTRLPSQPVRNLGGLVINWTGLTVHSNDYK